MSHKTPAARRALRFGLVPREYVPSTAHDKGRHGGAVIKHLLQPRTNRFALRCRIDDRLAKCELEELRPIGRIQVQHTRQTVTGASRYTDRAFLLEPRVPGHAHTGQLCYFFAPQTGSSPPLGSRQPDIGSWRCAPAGCAENYSIPAV
jgi:hypothetical protein